MVHTDPHAADGSSPVMGTAALEARSLTDIQRAVLRTLVYFDIFQHPLRQDELVRFLHIPCKAQRELDSTVQQLVEDGLLDRKAEHYTIRGSRADLAARQAGEQRAMQRKAKAIRMSRLIGRFPYVRAVMMSGSMSKGVLAKDGDLDFFVITGPGRLWVARTLLIAYKKVFLLNSHRDLCVNYFVDTAHLGIEDRNLFTATEVMTLMPMVGPAVCTAFFAENRWALEHLPNAERPSLDHVLETAARIQRLAERWLSGSLGDRLDTWCMMRTKERWRRKFPQFDAERFELALRSRTYVSKHHPRNYQKKVLTAFASGLHAFEQRTGLTVT